MKKEKIKNIVLIMILMVITSTITSYATSSYLYDSIDVKYDNSNGVQAETVQGAIDELYSCASDYSSLNNKINGYFQNNPTPFFNESSLVFVNNNKIVGTLANNDDNNGIALVGWDNNESGKGKLELYGNPVTINGKDAAIKYGIECSGYPNSSDDLLRCIRNQISSFPHETPFLILASFYGNRYGIGYVYNGDAYANFTIFNFDGLTVNIRNINGTWSYKYISDYSNYITVN